MTDNFAHAIAQSAHMGVLLCPHCHADLLTPVSAVPAVQSHSRGNAAIIAFQCEYCGQASALRITLRHDHRVKPPQEAQLLQWSDAPSTGEP